MVPDALHWKSSSPAFTVNGEFAIAIARRETLDVVAKRSIGIGLIKRGVETYSTPRTAARIPQGTTATTVKTIERKNAVRTENSFLSSSTARYLI